MDKIVLVKEATTSRSFFVEDDGQTNVYLLDLIPGNSDVTISFALGKRASSRLVISSFANLTSVKNYKVDLLHSESDGVSKCDFFGVATDQSALEVVMRTEIRKGTTNTNSSQNIKGIMLSNEAMIHGEPKLIIDDNNVKAAHSLGVGQLNPEHLFYLLSRGIAKKEAVGLLISGYFNEVVAHIPDEGEREVLNRKIMGMVN